MAPQWRIFGNTSDLQTHYDVAVVIATIARKDLAIALESIFKQDLRRIQVLIGIDKPSEDLSFLGKILQACPKNITVNILYPGYSTNIRHGGLTLEQSGGALRAALTLFANSKHVAYLDDDNWWSETHLQDLKEAIRDKAWAFSLRYFVHPLSKKPVCIDEWESVGPYKGFFLKRFDGFVDPSSLMINKELCWQCIPLWNIPLNGDPRGMSADRNVFNYLKDHSKPGSTGKATSFYVLDPADGMHPFRLSVMGEKYRDAS
jgi:hypothetical protein